MDTTAITKPKMLTINETAKTGILSEWALRALVKQGKIPGIYVGNRFLINYDRFCDWLNNSGNTSSENTSH